MNGIILGLIASIILGGLGVKTVVDNQIPDTYDVLFKKYGAEFQVPWKMLKAICMIESKIGRAPSVVAGLMNPSNIEGSKSYDGKSWGIMQVTLTTAKDLDPNATVEKLNNPEYSVWLAAKYFKFLMGRFPMNDSRYWEWVVKSYNQGPGNSAKERAGTSQGFAHDYWTKYQKYSQQIT